MSLLDLAGYGIDVILTVGVIALTLLGIGVALIPIVLGVAAFDEVATRWHGRQLAHHAQAYANHPTHPRKEKP